MKNPEYDKSTMPGMLIKPVVYEEFHTTLELEILSRVFDFGRIRFRLNRRKQFESKEMI